MSRARTRSSAGRCGRRGRRRARACRRPSSRSTSSWTTSTASAGVLKNFAAAAIERPDSFMYVSGLTSASLASSRRISASWPENFERQRAAVSPRELVDDHPADVVAVRAYSRPGLPSPATSRSSVEADSPRRKRRTDLAFVGCRTRPRLPPRTRQVLRQRPPALPRPRPPRPRASSPSSPSTSSGSGSSTLVGTVTVASTVSGSSR